MTYVGDILELAYGKALKAANRHGGKIPVVGSGGIVGSHSIGITSGPTIVIGRKGSIGSVTWIDGDAWPIDTAYYVKLKHSDIDARWLYWMLKNLQMETMNKSAAVPGLNRDDVYRLNTHVPPLPEQRHIAAILDHADALRTKRLQVLAHLESLTQSVFQNMFGDKQWRTAPLSDVVQAGTIVTYGIVQAGPEVDGGVPYIRTSDIMNGQISMENLRHTSPDIAARFSRSAVRPGDIVMSIRATVGTTAAVPPELEGANLTQGTARISPGHNAAGSYLLEFLRSPKAQHWIQRQVKGATFREITLGRLRELPVDLPPASLQREFIEISAKIEEETASAAHAIAASNELFASLQARAFRGEL